MSNYEKYSVTQYAVSSILGFIEAGEIAIPEIQRPFVWKGKQVRDLIDSLYNGYPTGYLIIWQNPDVKLKNGESALGKKVLIDGQQRITALMTAIAGCPVLSKDYKETRIKIAFDPLAENEEDRFAVQTPIHINTKRWVPDISLLFRPDFSPLTFMRNYLVENPEAQESKVEQAISRLLGIKNCQLGVITLAPQLEVGEVTEIFVRINSQGKRLNEADFAMSKIAADEQYGGNLLRKVIDYFCHLAIEPAFYKQIKANDKDFMASEYASKIQWLKDDRETIYDPDYGDMLRVSFMHKFGQGKLANLVSLLSGRDFKDRSFKAEIAEDSFKRLSEGVVNFVNQYNFEQFILAMKSAGFIAPKLLNSKMTLDFAYTLYLLLQQSSEIPKTQIKKYVQKWFVLSTLTSRYIGSPESQMDRDLRGIKEVGFLEFIKAAEEALLSDTFWNVALVQNLETSTTNSPFFNVFLAAQIFNADRSLFSNSAKVADLVSITGDVHHIFPSAYLKSHGIDDKSKYNQIANYTYLDTGINISIGKKEPADYFSLALQQQENKNEFYENLLVNCIPQEVMSMTATDYFDFLLQRRKLMASKIEKYYKAL